MKNTRTFVRRRNSFDLEAALHDTTSSLSQPQPTSTNLSRARGSSPVETMHHNSPLLNPGCIVPLVNHEAQPVSRSGEPLGSRLWLRHGEGQAGMGRRGEGVEGEVTVSRIFPFVLSSFLFSSLSPFFTFLSLFYLSFWFTLAARLIAGQWSVCLLVEGRAKVCLQRL